MMTSSISAAGDPESASAALMAAEPSCGAVRPGEDALESAPTGVRRADKMTTGSEFIANSLKFDGERLQV